MDPQLTREFSVAQYELRLGVETEYIEQDQPWASYHSEKVGGIMRSDHAEVETTNVTVRFRAELCLTNRWRVGLMLPLVHREHLHLDTHEEEGGADNHTSLFPRHDESEDGEVTIGDATGVPQRWNFTRLGDMQMITSYSLLPADESIRTEVQVYAGLKLPTGETGIRNGDGERAEITLQPGTGSVEPILGVRAQHQLQLSGADNVVPLSFGLHLKTEGSDGRYGYRPGTEVICSTGASYSLFRRLHPVFQINFRYRDRDHVGNAPGVPKEHTGGEALFLSPGFWLGLTDDLDANVFVQVPVLQRVNGIQLVSNWNLLVGLSYRFQVI